MATQVQVPALKGAKISDIRRVTQEECEHVGVEHDYAFGVVLDNGIMLFALRDPEGNGLGHMIGLHGQNAFDVTPE